MHLVMQVESLPLEISNTHITVRGPGARAHPLQLRHFHVRPRGCALIRDVLSMNWY